LVQFVEERTYSDGFFVKREGGEGKSQNPLRRLKNIIHFIKEKKEKRENGRGKE